ncbi:hypothetical protein BT69DRAFT_96896 [Atractiella rhizophila]|nr:hypothetical protein BT69DRAFT_96896 [Atractiella rhizophila]
MFNPKVSAEVDRLRGPKKLVIKNKRSSTCSPASSSSSIATLLTSLRQLFNQSNENGLPYQTLYSTCEGLVTSATKEDNEMLYDGVRAEVELKAAKVVEDLEQRVAVGREEEWLAHVDSELKAYFRKVLVMRAVFLPLDRNYVLKRPNLLSLWFAALTLMCQRLKVEQGPFSLAPRFTDIPAISPRHQTPNYLPHTHHRRSRRYTRFSPSLHICSVASFQSFPFASPVAILRPLRILHLHLLFIRGRAVDSG